MGRMHKCSAISITDIVHGKEVKTVHGLFQLWRGTHNRCQSSSVRGTCATLHAKSRQIVLMTTETIITCVPAGSVWIYVQSRRACMATDAIPRVFQANTTPPPTRTSQVAVYLGFM